MIVTRIVRGLVAIMLLGMAVRATASELTFLGAVFDGAGGADGLEHAQDLAPSPDGLHVYVASEEENSVALFTRDAASGALTFVQKWVDGVAGVDGIEDATGVAVSPDGKHVYVTGVADNGLAVFAREAATGLLTFVEADFNGVGGVSGLDGSLNVIVSPDGAHVYVAAYDDGAVSVFSRDAVTGALTFVEAEFDGVGGVTGLINATTPAISPDGKHVYVTGQNGDGLVVFTRDAGTGALTFVEAQLDGVGGVDGLDGAYGVVVSPDGDHVYVGSYEDHAIVTFARNQTTGALSFAGAQFDDTGGIDGLNWPLSLAMSDDGTKLYVAGSYTDHALSVFERDPPTGALTFLEVHENGVAGVTGLVACNTVRTSPDGKHVYTTARDPGSLAIFATPAGLPTTTTISTTSSTSSTTVTTTSSTTVTTATSTTVTTVSSTTVTTVAMTTTTLASTTSTSVPGTTSTSSTTPPSSTSTTETTSTVPTTTSTTTTLPGCTPAPRAGCREAETVRLRVRDRSSDAKDRLAFRWRHGAATALADFGTPLELTTYRLCVYAEAALVLQATVPPGRTCGKRPCWRTTKKGFRYLDRSRAADGITAIALKSGGEGSAAVSVTGAGPDLPLPAAPLQPPLVVQVQASDAECWHGDVASP